MNTPTWCPPWRLMRAEDLAAVQAIAEAVHHDFPEDISVFAERLRLAPAGCLMLDGLGYLISHPWRLDAPPALNSPLGAIPPEADGWYLHDLALLPAARGTGAGRAAVARAIETAQAAGLARMALIAVGGSAPFWARQGFVETPLPAAKLASYGEGARYMRR